MPKNILIITPIPTHPQTSGNRARVFTLVLTMRAMGYNVTLLHLGMEEGDIEEMQKTFGENYIYYPYSRPVHRLRNTFRKILRRFKSQYAYLYALDEWYDPGLDNVIKQLVSSTRFDVVQVEYVFLSRALNNFGSDVLKVLDTHDVFTDRHQRYLKHGEKPKWYSASAHSESIGLNRADIVIAIQDKERIFFESITDRKVITLGHITPVFEFTKNKIQKGRILYIASDNRINIQAAEYFIEQIFPLVLKQNPSAEFAVAGKICNSLKDHPGLLKLGVLPDLKPAYESAAVVVNPILFGTGLKIKSIEALGYSRPLVTTSVGAEGLEDGVGGAFLSGDTPDAFAQSLLTILGDDAFAERLSRSAYQYTIEWNRKCAAELDSLLSKKANTTQNDQIFSR